jgi:predicted DNA-binding transcriptional regulator AlpA
MSVADSVEARKKQKAKRKQKQQRRVPVSTKQRVAQRRNFKRKRSAQRQTHPPLSDADIADDDPELGSRLLSKAEVLARVNVTFPTIWTMMRAGTFPRARVVGGKSMWLKHEIDAWIEAVEIVHAI